MKRIALALAILTSGHFAQASWYAFAYSAKANNIGSNNNPAATKAQAEAQALSDCEKPDCKVIRSTEAQYLAFSIGAHGAQASGEGDTLEDAVFQSFQACGGMKAECHWRFWQSNTGKDDHYSEADTGPIMRVPVASIGHFNEGWDNFPGIKQEGDNLCWAAGLDSMIRAKFGITLSQWALGQLQSGDEPESNEALENSRIPVSINHACNPQTHEGCDHGSAPLPIANALGISLPISMYPKTTDAIGTWKAIQASIDKGFPVGLVIRWYTGGSHMVILHHAVTDDKYNTTEDKVHPNMFLDVFDPEDGHTYVMTNNDYLPDYEKIPGRFTGQIVLLNYANPAAILNPRLCKFVENDPKGLCGGK